MARRWLALGMGLAAGTLGVTVLRNKRKVHVAEYFRGRGCVVTGGGSGIGLEIVDQLVDLGARVLAVDIDAGRLAALRERRPSVHTAQINMLDADAPARLIAAGQQALGRIETAFSNAGICVAGPFLTNGDDEIERLIAVNLTSHLRVARHLVPAMIAAGGGDLNFTVSLSAWIGAPTLAAYSGTKGGLKSFIYALRREVDGRVIRISGLHPNVVRTNLMPGDVFDRVNMKYGTPETVRALLQGVAEGRRDIFVNAEDRLLQRLEQFAPGLIDRYLASRPDARAIMEESRALQSDAAK